MGAAFFCLGLSGVLAWEPPKYASRRPVLSALTKVPCDLRRMSAAQPHQIGRGEFELETAAAGRDEDRLVVVRGAVDDDRDGPPGAQRADPADHPAGRPFRGGGLRHNSPSAAAGGREPLEIEVAIDRDDRQDEPAIDHDGKGLEDPPGFDAEGGRGIRAVPGSRIAVPAVSLWRGVRVDAVADASPRDELDRGGAGGGHGPIVAISAMLEAVCRPSAFIDARRQTAVALLNGARGGTTSGANA